VWGNGPDDVWVVGEAGAVLRWDGEAWQGFGVGEEDLYAVWASGPDDVWVGGVAGVVRWDGTSWHRFEEGVKPAHTEALHGFGPGDVWASGPGGVWQWDGTAWAEHDEPAARGRGLGGTGSSDLWAGSRSLVRYDGASFSVSLEAFSVGATPPAELTDVWASAPDDAWALAWSNPGLFYDPRMGVGRARLFRWDGSAWTEVAEQRSHGFALWGYEGCVWLAGNSMMPVWAAEAGTCGDGVESLRPLYGAWGSAPDDLWAVGLLGQVARWDGSTWTRSRDAAPEAAIDALSVSPSGTVWMIVDGQLWEMSSDGTLEPTGESAAHLFVRSDDDVWVSDGTGVRRWDGSAWHDVASFAADALWVVSSAEAYATRSEGLWRWDGTDWSEWHADATGWSLWRSPEGELWVLGNETHHWDGESWTSHTRRAAQAHGTSGDDVWFVPTTGAAIGHWDGSTLETTELETEAQVESIWSEGPDSVWAFGGTATTSAAWHWDGASWSEVRAPHDNRLRWAAGGSDGLWVTLEDGFGLLFRPWD